MRQGNEEPQADAARPPGGAERGERASGEESALFDFAEWLGAVAPESPVATRRLAERVMGVEGDASEEAASAETSAEAAADAAPAEQDAAEEAGTLDAAPADDVDYPPTPVGDAAPDAGWTERPRVFDPFGELRGLRADDVRSGDDEPRLDDAAANVRWDEPTYAADPAATPELPADAPADAYADDWRATDPDVPGYAEAAGFPSPYLRPPLDPHADASGATHDLAPPADAATPLPLDERSDDDAASRATPPRRRLMSAVTQPRGRTVEGAPNATAADPKARRRYVAAGAVGLMVVSAAAIAVSLSTVVERERTGGVTGADSAATIAAAADAAPPDRAAPTSAGSAGSEGAAGDVPASAPVSFATTSGASASTIAPVSFAGARGRSASVLAAAEPARAAARPPTPTGAAAAPPRVASAATRDSAAADSAAADSAAAPAAAPAAPERGGVRGLASRLWGAARGAIAGIASGRRSGDASAFAVAGASASADSAPVLLPHPPALIGRWIHGDPRTKYGDSLTMVLNADGTAKATERRYILDRTGWHPARVAREGRWEMRYGRNERLCTFWEKPKQTESCEPVDLSTDTASDLPLLRYAGRHWRPPRTDRSPDERPRRSRPDDE